MAPSLPRQTIQDLGVRPLSLSAGIPLRASAYDAADLCADIERFSFLLGGNGGEHLLA
jgi:hypothetical protein